MPDAFDRGTRRAFLRRGALAGSALAAAGTAAADPAAAPAPITAPHTDEALPVEAWSRAPGTPVGVQPYGKPSGFEAGVVRHVRANSVQYLSASTRSPLQELDGIITPNGLFFERHHAGIPDIDPARHRLLVHGRVRRALLFTPGELRRFPSVSRIHFLECSGNPGFNVFGETAQLANGLVSCAEWTGVPVRTVLEEAGLLPDAAWVIAEGADGAGMTRSIPLAKCLDDALLVYSQNGERLRPEQGYPLRLLLPGYEGNMSVKWLRRLHVRRESVQSREETSKYTDLMPDGTARQFTFVMEAKSIITTPSGGQRLTAPGFHEIRGIAWSGRGRIARVEVSVDEGRSWQDAALQSPVLTRALTRFRLPWQWDGRPAVIQSRAIDETGYVQPTLEALLAARGDRSGYHNNSITPWRIAADGQVRHARA